MGLPAFYFLVLLRCVISPFAPLSTSEIMVIVRVIVCRISAVSSPAMSSSIYISLWASRSGGPLVRISRRTPSMPMHSLIVSLVFYPAPLPVPLFIVVMPLRSSRFAISGSSQSYASLQLLFLLQCSIVAVGLANDVLQESRVRFWGSTSRPAKMGISLELNHSTRVCVLTFSVEEPVVLIESISCWLLSLL